MYRSYIWYLKYVLIHFLLPFSLDGLHCKRFALPLLSGLLEVFIPGDSCMWASVWVPMVCPTFPLSPKEALLCGNICRENLIWWKNLKYSNLFLYGILKTSPLEWMTVFMKWVLPTWAPWFTFKLEPFLMEIFKVCYKLLHSLTIFCHNRDVFVTIFNSDLRCFSIFLSPWMLICICQCHVPRSAQLLCEGFICFSRPGFHAGTPDLWKSSVGRNDVLLHVS